MPVRALLIVCMLAVIGVSAPSRAYVEPVIPTVSVFEDADGRFSAADVTAPGFAGKFVPLKDGRLNAGLSSSVWWLRFTVPRPARAGERRVLEVGLPILDRVDLFLVRDGKIAGTGKSGESVGYAERSYSDRRVSFLIPPADAGATVYLRISSQGFVSAQPKLWPEGAYLERRADQAALDGLYYGALGFVVIFNFFLFFGFRDPVFLLYSAMMFSLMLFEAKLHGYLDQLLFPALPALANPATSTLGLLAVAMPCLFVRAFLQLRQRQPFFDKLYLGVVAATLLCLIGQTLVSFGTAFIAAMVLGLIAIILWVVSMLRAVFQGYTPAMYLFLGQLLIAPATIVFILRSMGRMESTLFTENILEFALMGEAILISLGLSARVALLRRDKRAAETALASERARIASKLAYVQEEEKRRISADLHDSVGQSLLVVVNGLKQLAARAVGPKNTAADLAKNAQGVLDDVRNISNELHPHQVSRVGLSSALRDLAARLFANEDIALSTDIDPGIDRLLDKDAQLQVYRAMQAALANCVRHAQASEVKMSGRIAKSSVAFQVSDNGVGFANGERPASGLGQQTMSERMSLIGADCEIESEPGRGTTVRLRIPVEAAR